MELSNEQAEELKKQPYTREVLIERGNYPLSLIRYHFEDGTFLQEVWVTDEDGRPYADYALGKTIVPPVVAATTLRAVPSEARSQTSRENGKKGGRPKKIKENN